MATNWATRNQGTSTTSTIASCSPQGIVRKVRPKISSKIEYWPIVLTTPTTIKAIERSNRKSRGRTPV